MVLTQMKEFKIGDLTIKLPIIQGGMGVGISMSGLASAVANEGGVGVIATAGIGMLEPDFNENFLEANKRALKKEIEKAREFSKGIIGVNIMVALSNYADLVKTSIQEKVDIIFSGAGLPLNLPEFLKQSGSRKTKLVPIVSSGRAADYISKRWIDEYNYPPDAFVVEGPLAGGHLGFKRENIDNPAFALENIMVDVIRGAKQLEERFGRSFPVIVGGGIYTGMDIKKFLQLGASAVQMATRFVTTKECDADDKFKQTYIEAKKEDIVIIKSPVGLPGRAINNKFIEDTNNGERKPFTCPYHCIITCDYKQSPYCIALALLNAFKGNFKNGFAFAGANVGRAKEIVSVKELIETIKKEFES
ncbi:MAG: NAD(P)H-dependent flavin oxidoreductase [bacterium]